MTERLRAELEFYARPHNWKRYFDNYQSYKKAVLYEEDVALYQILEREKQKRGRYWEVYIVSQGESIKNE